MTNDPCPHCHTRAKHGERVSCCSGCGTLFSSGTAFDRHRKDFGCLNPVDAGLVPRPAKTDPDATAWGLPAGKAWWDQ